MYDLFVEVTNVTKGNGIWAHFASTFCCIFKCIRINWLSINVTGISGTMITMPDIAYVLIFTDNDLTNITEDHFKIKLIARLLDQIYVVQPPMFPPRYDDALPQEYEYSQSSHILVQMAQDHQHLSSQNICFCYLPTHRHRVWLYDKNLLYIGFMITMI